VSRQLQERLRTVLLAETAKPYVCSDCGERAHPYMVRNPLWVAVGMTFATNSHLCLTCLGKRCERDLTQRDFPAYQPINVWLCWRRKKLVLKPPEAAWAALAEVARSARWIERDRRLILGDTVVDTRKLDAFAIEALMLHRSGQLRSTL
jgi:hypothetical protein